MAKEIVPGLAGIPVAHSGVSFIDGDQGILEYRGIPIQTLLEEKQCNYLEVAYLLFNGVFPAADELQHWNTLIGRYRILDAETVAVLAALPKGGHPMHALTAAIATLGMLYAAKDQGEPSGRYRTMARLLGQLPSLVAAFHRLRNNLEVLPPKDELDHAGNFLWMLRGKLPTELERKVLDTVFIVHADHTLNASTFAARVTASTLSDLYLAIASAVAALNGPLHGGATQATLLQLRSIGSKAQVGAWVDAILAKKEKIMGLGHRVYKVKDPRAPILERLAEKLFAEQGAHPLYEVAMELERVAKAKLGYKGIYPNVDFFSGLVYDKLGIPVDLFIPMFAIGRIAGWLAHLREQLEDNHLYRPEQIYTGSHNQSYVPIDKRGKQAKTVWSNL
jgi:citrate synthase